MNTGTMNLEAVRHRVERGAFRIEDAVWLIDRIEHLEETVRILRESRHDSDEDD